MMKSTVSGSTPTTKSSESFALLQDGGIYVSINAGKGKAPLTLAASLSRIHHKADCIRKASLYHESSAIHTTRGFCSCMSPFEIDKQVCLELLSRELVVDAFFCLLPLIERCGIEKILSDAELTLVLVRYDFLSFFYYVLNKDRLDGDSGSSRSPTWLPLLDLNHYSFIGNTNLPRIEDVISRASWKRLCHFVQKDLRLHYLREFARSFDAKPLMQVVSLTDFLFAAFKTCPEEPSKALIRIDCYLDCSLEALVAVMSETDMTKEWVPYFRFPMHVGLECCENLGQLGRLDRVTYYKIALPWPFSDEEVILHGWLVDDLAANNRLVICFRGIDDEYPVTQSLGAVQYPSGQSRNKRIYVEGGCRVRVEDQKRVRLEMMWNIDLKMSIPSTLVKFIAKTFVKAGINSLKGVCMAADTDPIWLARRKKFPWLYRFVADKMSSILSSLDEKRHNAIDHQGSKENIGGGDVSTSARRKRDIFRRSRVAV